MDTKELKMLTERFGLEQLESCIQQQIAGGTNECAPAAGTTAEIIETLSKAGVVREIMDQGLTFPEALRELGRKIRAVYGQEAEDQNGRP